jgi:hypothetical protein
MPISPSITPSPSAVTQLPSEEIGARDNLFAETEGQARASTRFQNRPPQLQARAPRPRPASSSAGANGQQAGASSDPDHPVEQHVRTGAQLLHSAGAHHEAGLVGSGQMGAASHGVQNASAANRTRATGAAEAAASLTMGGKIAMRSLAMQPSLNRLQQAGYKSASRRLEDFADFGMGAQTVSALQARLVNVDMNRFKSMRGGMTPDIGIMHACINLAAENNSISPMQARLAKCNMGMAEASNVLGNCVGHAREDTGVPMITQQYSDELASLIGARHGELTEGMDLSFPADENDKMLTLLESEFGKGGEHIVLWAAELHNSITTARDRAA